MDIRVKSTTKPETILKRISNALVKMNDGDDSILTMRLNIFRSDLGNVENEILRGEEIDFTDGSSVIWVQHLPNDTIRIYVDETVQAKKFRAHERALADKKRKA